MANQPARRSLRKLLIVWGVAGLYGFLRTFGWWDTANDADISALLVLALILTVLITYFGIFEATRTVRAAIASAFIVTYLIAVISPDAAGFVKATFGEEFRGTVAMIIGFYFLAEAAVQGTKVVGASFISKNQPQADARAAVAIDGDGAP